MDEVYVAGRADGFRLELRFTGRVHPRHRPAIRAAADRWAELVTGPKLPGRPPVMVMTTRRWDKNYLARTVAYETWPPDAGPLAGRPSYVEIALNRDVLPSLGPERLRQLAMHEMAHGLGMGLAWTGLLEKQANGRWVFIGKRAMAEYGRLLNPSVPAPVPVDYDGRNTHWSASVFSGEMMNPKLHERILPLSGVTLASLVDLGYEVKVEAADAFVLQPKP